MGEWSDATYDVHGSGVPVFGIERGKAVCAQGLDDGDFRPLRGVVMIATSRGKEYM